MLVITPDGWRVMEYGWYSPVFTHPPRDSGLALLGRCIVQKGHCDCSIRGRLNLLIRLLWNTVFVGSSLIATLRYKKCILTSQIQPRSGLLVFNTNNTQENHYTRVDIKQQQNRAVQVSPASKRYLSFPPSYSARCLGTSTHATCAAVDGY